MSFHTPHRFPQRTQPLSRARGPLSSLLQLGEALCAVLCLWAAWAHTPPGALLRTAVAKVLGTRAATRPLLSYYSAGVYRPSTKAAEPPAPPPRALQPAEALGYGAWVVVTGLDKEDRAEVAAYAASEGTRGELLDAKAGPALLGALLHKLSARFGSDDLAAVALYCGNEAAGYAARAAGARASLEEIARVLPERLCEDTDLAGQTLLQATAAGLSWPVEGSARVTSPYGDRNHPVLGQTRLHKGVDLSVPVGTAVHAVGAARVRRASEDDLNGRILVLDHGHGVSTLYLHNDELLVGRGAVVARQEVVAKSGNTGRSTGPHLHYQLELGGVAVDPLRYRAQRPR
jgi:murein DD-endopeptidase MepM/ murein hydrolase activator NlpD